MSETSANGPIDLAEQVTEGLLGPNPFVGLRAEDVVTSFRAIGEQAILNPMLVIEQEAALIRELIAVLAGRSQLGPPKGDKRFVDQAWQENPLYRMMLQGYVAWTNALQAFVDRSGLDNRSKDRARFAVSLMTDALAPTNTVLGNPAALRKTWEERGQNLVKGLKNLIDDIANNGGLPSQVDKRAFAVGDNLALSPGKVVFRNPVLELIQYSPTTAKVWSAMLPFHYFYEIQQQQWNIGAPLAVSAAPFAVLWGVFIAVPLAIAIPLLAKRCRDPKGWGER